VTAASTTNTTINELLTHILELNWDARSALKNYWSETYTSWSNIVNEVRSKSYRLITEHRHYNARPIQFYFSSSTVASHTFSAHANIIAAICVLNVRASSSPPRLPTVSNFVSVVPSVAKLTRREKSNTR